ncbi:translocation/assembly module TamB domain-containing protein [Haloferula sp.]|uniref:translocation/assembly module TamB domain-containing protein n=1 Tax=Haloferula sp. TaxID=2497595 RepID=UPI0032A0B244
MEEETEDLSQPKKQARPRWRKKRWRLLALFIGLLIWLDGPGWRLIGEKAAHHYVPGLTEKFELQGRLTGGNISIANFALAEMGVMNTVGLDQVSVDYQLGEIIKGKVRSLKLHGLHADVDLAKSLEKEEEEKEETDLPKLLRELRERIVPMEIELTEVSARIHRGDEDIFEIEPTSLIHAPGDPSIELRLGQMTILGDRQVEAQTTTIEWLEESLRLSSLEVLPDLEIRDLFTRFPIDEDMSFSTAIVVNGVKFMAETDLSTASFEKEEEPLLVHDTAEKLGFPIPLEVTLESLKLDVRNIPGGLETLEADVQLSTSSIKFEEWQSSRMAVAAKLAGPELNAAINGEALGSPLELEAKVAIDRTNGMQPEVADVEFTIPELEKVLTYLRDNLAAPKPDDEVADEKPADPPASNLKSKARLTFTEGAPDEATASLAITSSEQAPPINLQAEWKNGGSAKATIKIPGINAEGEFEPETKSYSGKAALEEFAPDSLDAWASPFGIALPPNMLANLTWSGSGKLEDNTHQGDLEITSFEWLRKPDEQEVKAFATASYQWPEKLELSPLNVQQGANKIEGDVTLKDQILELRKLSWSDGDDTLFNGTASVPVPEEISDVKALMRETRPISIDLESTELQLSKLHPFLPEETRFRADSHVKLDVKLSGSMAKPVLDARLVAKDVGLTSQPDIPLITVDLSTEGRGQTLKVEGDITGQDYPPMKIDVVTNWSPDQWAENPEVIKQAKLDASAKITDFNLALLADFLPTARKFEGQLNIDLEVGGTVGEPTPSGTVTVSGAALEMKDPSLPRFKDGEVKLSATPERVSLDGLQANVAGGSLNIKGALDLADGKPSKLDFTVKGKELPAMRNDSMIVRLNTDLAIRGPWETATISGKVGVIDSIFYKDIEILPIGVPFNQPSEPSLPSIDTPSATAPTEAVPAPFQDWGLNLKIATENPFLIRGNLANGQVFIKLALDGTIGKPRPDGEVTIWKTTAKLPFSTLNIQKGTVKFRPDAPFDPVLNIRGESTIRPYELKVYIYGPVSNPKVLPTSSPPLPETEIMTLIATGTTTSGFEDADAATARGAQLLIEEIRNGRVKYLQSLGPILKVIEKVDFQVGEKDPYTSTKYNSATLNLSDNWLVNAGISDEGDTRTTLIYLIRFR